MSPQERSRKRLNNNREIGDFLAPVFSRINEFATATELRYSRRAMSTAIQRHQFTVHDYHRMGRAGILRPEDRVELIYGEVIKMSPIGNPHNAACDRALRAFVRAAGDDAIVRVQGSVRLNLYNEPQPDLVLLTPRDDFYAKDGANAADILLIVEIGDTSLRYDQGLKALLYAEMGVMEYWVADLNAETIFVYSDPQEKAYRTIRQFHRGETLEPTLLPSCRIPVDSLLA